MPQGFCHRYISGDFIMGSCCFGKRGSHVELNANEFKKVNLFALFKPNVPDPIALDALNDVIEGNLGLD